ncbi:hypothetical protein T4C_14109 [Trichinella pseudospiralis]|uniref:Uncharacterized protein n=1 Tax=Trichinella pseudospiralis TaxID=6337 RepID=A0A0V1JYP3_TRIPS|nr:hypothetical protein T4C_14109 [Trichinella pseudospiralis]
MIKKYPPRPPSHSNLVYDVQPPGKAIPEIASKIFRTCQSLYCSGQQLHIVYFLWVPTLECWQPCEPGHE